MHNAKQKPQLLKRGTTLNYSGTTRNHLKPAILYFLLKISYFQVVFVVILHCSILIQNLIFIFPKKFLFIFLWQNLSQNLNFPKLPKIRYRDALLYVCCDFHSCFFGQIYYYSLFIIIIILLFYQYISTIRLKKINKIKFKKKIKKI